MDRQMKNAFEANNKQRQQITGVKTLKPDQWNYSNEKPMNGGFVDEKSGLMPFDSMEGDYMTLL